VTRPPQPVLPDISGVLVPTEDFMAFRLQDLCKTTRRASGNGLPRLFPRILGDDRLDPHLGIALRFFETHLGRPRHEFDAEALITLFGDSRLARGLIRCLSRTYRYRTRPLEDLLGAGRAAALAARGLTAPAQLRALAYARANQDGGFVAPEQRTAFLTDLIDGLHPTEIERALWLDAPDQALLVRDGPLPTAADVRSCYNIQVLETLLCSAPECHFALRGDRKLVEAVAARHAVQVSVDLETATLRGRPDAGGSWARHGVRVARAALTLLAAGALGPGTAIVQLGDRRYEVRLDAAQLRKALPPRGWSAPAAVWGVANSVARAVQTLRRHGRLAGWRLRWWPEPLVAEQGVVWPELTLRRGAMSIGLLPLPAAQLAADAVALGALAERLSFIILAHPEVPSDVPAALTVIPCRDDCLAALLDAYLECRGVSGGRDMLPEWLIALTEAARAAGSLAESDLARRLDCPEDEVGLRLTPAIDNASDLTYIDGFGLCTAALLEQARALIHEETATNKGRLELARIGRRLRSLVGRNEGLHALVAYLIGELRPVD
jgi:hypothetical protein